MTSSATIGGSIGGVLAFLIVIAIISSVTCFIWRRRKRLRQGALITPTVDTVTVDEATTTEDIASPLAYPPNTHNEGDSMAYASPELHLSPTELYYNAQQSPKHDSELYQQ